MTARGIPRRPRESLRGLIRAGDGREDVRDVEKGNGGLREVRETMDAMGVRYHEVYGDEGVSSLFSGGQRDPLTWTVTADDSVGTCMVTLFDLTPAEAVDAALRGREAAMLDVPSARCAGVGHYECSACGTVVGMSDRYCRRCGARLVGPRRGR